MIAEFGESWFLEPWHVELLPSARSMKSNVAGLVGLTEAERANMSIVRLDHTAEQVAADTDATPTDFAARKPRAGANREVFQAVHVLYVTQGLGARRIHRVLKESGVKPETSLSTVQRYLAIVKRQTGVVE